MAAKEADLITVRNQLESAFLRLPPEIRNTIYDYALSIERVICANPDRYYGTWVAVDVNVQSCQGRQMPLGNITAITTTCRQTRAECALTLFERTGFGGYWPTPMSWYEPFLNMLTRQQQQSTAFWWGGTWTLGEVKGCCVPFEYLGGLERLTIFVKYRPETASKCTEEEARVRDLMCGKVGTEVDVVFDYDNY